MQEPVGLAAVCRWPGKTSAQRCGSSPRSILPKITVKTESSRVSPLSVRGTRRCKGIEALQSRKDTWDVRRTCDCCGQSVLECNRVPDPARDLSPSPPQSHLPWIFTPVSAFSGFHMQVMTKSSNKGSSCDKTRACASHNFDLRRFWGKSDDGKPLFG